MESWLELSWGESTPTLGVGWSPLSRKPEMLSCQLAYKVALLHPPEDQWDCN